MRDSATQEELSLKRSQLDRQDPMKKLPATQGEDPARNLPKDLIGQSDIISFGGIATLIPKHAILQIPDNFANRVKFQANSQIKGWADFFAVNRGWITTVEITLAQAKGMEPLPENISKQLAKSGNLVVAVYQGGPISMLPLTPPAEKTGTVSAKP